MNKPNSRGLLVFSAPLILAALFEPLSGVVDTALVGQKQTHWLAALGLAATLLSTFTWMFNFLIHASTQSIASAGGRTEGADSNLSLVKTSLLMTCVVASVTAVLLYFFKSPLYSFVGVAPDLSPVVDEYFLVRLAGHPIILLSLTTLSILRGLKKVKQTLVLVILGTVLNGVLSFCALNFFDLGLSSVAMATVFSHGIVFVIGMNLVLLTLKKSWIELFKVKASEVKSFAQKSWHLFGRSLILSSCFFLATKFASVHGVTTLAAHQIALQIWLLSSFITDGLAQGATILLSYEQARGKSVEYLRQLVWQSLGIALSIGVIFALILGAGESWWSALFTTDQEVLSILKMVWPVLVWTQIYLAMTYVMDGVLMGLGQFRSMKWIMLSGTLVGFLPLGRLSLAPENYIYLWMGFALLGLWRLLVGGVWVQRYFRLLKLSSIG